MQFHASGAADAHNVLAVCPEAVLTWNNRAILLRKQGRSDDAVASAQCAIDVNPAYAKAWTSKANALLQSGRVDEALAAAETVLGLDPTLTGPYLAKASSLAQLGQFAGARSCIARALVLKPGDPQLLKARDLFAKAPWRLRPAVTIFCACRVRRLRASSRP